MRELCACTPFLHAYAAPVIVAADTPARHTQANLDTWRGFAARAINGDRARPCSPARTPGDRLPETCRRRFMAMEIILAGKPGDGAPDKAGFLNADLALTKRSRFTYIQNFPSFAIFAVTRKPSPSGPQAGTRSSYDTERP